MSHAGATFYVAPEMIRQELYGTPADVYSIGVVLWEIFSLSSPRDYFNMLREQFEEATRRYRNPPNDFPKLRSALAEGRATQQWLPTCGCWPGAIRTLVGTCMAHDPTERPTMQQVCGILEGEINRASATEAWAK
jgi:serine/threonine protein kinase